MVGLLKQKKIIIPVLFLLIVFTSGLISYVVISNVSDKTKEEQANSKKEEKKPASTPREVKAPTPSSPEKCKEYSTAVTQVLGDQDKQVGFTSKTDDQSTLIQCGYYKGKIVTTIKVYQYPTEVEAAAALSKWKVGGYETQNKGKYIISVSVALETGPDIVSSSNILASVLQKQ